MFENYNWGIGIADVQRTLKNKNIKAMAGQRAIMARKEIYGTMATIEFLFTYKSLKLYCVMIRFEGDKFDRIKNYLILEYEQGDCANLPAKDCFWRDSGTFIRLTERPFDIVILYGNKDWYKIHGKEMD